MHHAFPWQHDNVFYFFIFLIVSCIWLIFFTAPELWADVVKTPRHHSWESMKSIVLYVKFRFFFHMHHCISTFLHLILSVILWYNCSTIAPLKLFTVHSSLSSITLYCETSFFTLPDKMWTYWTRQVLVQILKYSLLKAVHSFFCFFWPWIHPCRTFPFNLELEEEPSWMPRNRQLCLPFLHASS